MNVLMFSNTYAPHVGGVARSVATWAQALRTIGHKVLVVTPQTTNHSQSEPGVLRYPALKSIYRREFSFPLPVLPWQQEQIGRFRPDLIHSHHPFLLGHTALRLATEWKIPLVFTNHTQYHLYTHYAGIRSPVFRSLIQRIAVAYANQCDAVIAPSESIALQLRDSGVTRPIQSIPTGIDIAQFSDGDGSAFRRRLGINSQAFVIGHVGRLAREKNLEFLLEATFQCLHRLEHARAVIAGDGPFRQELQRRIATSPLHDRFSLLGNLSSRELRDVYACFDVFAFTSISETQGLVIAEAMAAGAPVIALDAPGVREVVRDGVNGRLLRDADESQFAEAIVDVASWPLYQRREFQRQARSTAEAFSMPRCVSRLTSVYDSLAHDEPIKATNRLSVAGLLRGEAKIWRSLVCAAKSLMCDSVQG